ncbi:MAG: ABC transporter permease subunit [bacterium]|nr:ABC transporter permease subunit [bacterium]
MLRILIEKEWKSVLLSPKFALTFAVCSVLILLSIGVGIREYRAFEHQQAAAAALLAEELQVETSWRGLSTRVFRDGDPMQIFVAGVHNDVGRLAPISGRTEASLGRSIYSDDTILAIFRALDLSFIVRAILSLFAILFTYDAINGERESGTLRLIFSSAVSRGRFVLAKFVGTWLGLAVPLVLPALLGVLLVVLFRVPLDADHWGRLGVFALGSGLYFTCFIALGIAVSALTRRPASSFLILLVSWVMVVLVIPRASLLAAVEMVPVPTVAEIESRKAGFENRTWEDHRRDLEQRWREHQAEMAGLSEADAEAYEDEHLWAWLEEDDEARKATETRIAEHAARLNEQLRNRKAEQRRLALSLSRLSPASAYQLAAMNLAGTGLSLKTRYEDRARTYREAFVSFAGERAAGTRHVVRRRGGGGGGVLSDAGAQQPLDLSEMPRFQAPRLGFREAVAPVPADLGLLALESLLGFVVGFVGFLRYDVR